MISIALLFLDKNATVSDKAAFYLVMTLGMCLLGMVEEHTSMERTYLKK